MFYHTVKKGVIEILTSKPLKILVCFTFSLLLISGIFLAFNGARLPSLIVLHFDAFHGIDRFGSYGDLWILWTIGTAIIFLNYLLAYELFNRERALSYFFIGINLLIALLEFIALVTILYIN